MIDTTDTDTNTTDAAATAATPAAQNRVAPSSEAPQGRSLWVGRQEAPGDEPAPRDPLADQQHPQAALEGATRRSLHVRRYFPAMMRSRRLDFSCMLSLPLPSMVIQPL